jgi:hypothetical protein
MVPITAARAAIFANSAKKTIILTEIPPLKVGKLSVAIKRGEWEVRACDRSGYGKPDEGPDAEGGKLDDSESRRRPPGKFPVN